MTTTYINNSPQALARRQQLSRLAAAEKAIAATAQQRNQISPADIANRTRAAQSQQLSQYRLRLDEAAREIRQVNQARWKTPSPANVARHPGGLQPLNLQPKPPPPGINQPVNRLPAPTRTPSRPPAATPGAATLLNPLAIIPATLGAAQLTGSIALTPVGLFNSGAARLANDLRQKGNANHNAAFDMIFGPLNPGRWFPKNPGYPTPGGNQPGSPGGSASPAVPLGPGGQPLPGQPGSDRPGIPVFPNGQLPGRPGSPAPGQPGSNLPGKPGNPYDPYQPPQPGQPAPPWLNPTNPNAVNPNPGSPTPWPPGGPVPGQPYNLPLPADPNKMFGFGAISTNNNNRYIVYEQVASFEVSDAGPVFKAQIDFIFWSGTSFVNGSINIDPATLVIIPPEGEPINGMPGTPGDPRPPGLPFIPQNDLAPATPPVTPTPAAPPSPNQPQRQKQLQQTLQPNPPKPAPPFADPQAPPPQGTPDTPKPGEPENQNQPKPAPPLPIPFVPPIPGRPRPLPANPTPPLGQPKPIQQRVVPPQLSAPRQVQGPDVVTVQQNISQPKPGPSPQPQNSPQNNPQNPREDDPPSAFAVKVWNSITKKIEIQTVLMPPKLAGILALIANENAEAQQDSHIDRAEKNNLIQRVLARLQIMRILQIMSTIATLHNAAMLSKNLAQTLGDAATSVLTSINQWTGIFGEGANLDVNELIGQSFDTLMKNALGNEVWTGTKQSWLRANRILASASQIIWTIRSIGDSARAIAEWTAENTGKIGNALKKWSVVGEKAYGWMPERVTARTAFQKKFDRFREGVDNLDDAASSFTATVSEVGNIAEEGNELKKHWDELGDQIQNAQKLTRPENQPAKAADDLAKSISQGLDITPADLERADNATT